MADIKTRDTVKGTIKTLDKAAVAGQKMKQAYIATKDKAEHSVNTNENTAEEYAADKTEAGIDEIAHKGAYSFDKAGRKGVGINSKIWIGKAVTRACHYANYGNKDGNPAIVFGSCSYNNMIDQLIKNDPDKNPKGWFTYHKDEGEGDYYTANIIKTGFDNWINSGMKID